jgi:hypothetical protein
LDDIQYQRADGNRDRAQRRPVRVAEYHDPGEWDGRTSDGESGESGDASRPSQGEADDQEGEQVGAEHRHGDRGGQTKISRQLIPLDRHGAGEQQQRHRVEQDHFVQY